jgi:hypothetical protein
MSDNSCIYLCAQLRAALSDSPGGEKAWVPLRRGLVLACVEQLQNAAATDDLLQWLQGYMAQNGIAAIEHNAGGHWAWTARGIGGTVHTRRTLAEAVDAAAAEFARCAAKAAQP